MESWQSRHISVKSPMTRAFPPALSGHAQDSTQELRPRFDANGLVAAIAQDAETGEVLMLAWMNAEALRVTLETRKGTYWSRSRGKLWVKGETSGNTQDVVDVLVDCDQDAIILKVRQSGGACHTGRKSCFYRHVDADGAALSEWSKSDKHED